MYIAVCPYRGLTFTICSIWSGSYSLLLSSSIFLHPYFTFLYFHPHFLSVVCFLPCLITCVSPGSAHFLLSSCTLLTFAQCHDFPVLPSLNSLSLLLSVTVCLLQLPLCLGVSRPDLLKTKFSLLLFIKPSKFHLCLEWQMNESSSWVPSIREKSHFYDTVCDLLLSLAESFPHFLFLAASLLDSWISDGLCHDAKCSSVSWLHLIAVIVHLLNDLAFCLQAFHKAQRGEIKTLHQKNKLAVWMRNYT